MRKLLSRLVLLVLLNLAVPYVAPLAADGCTGCDADCCPGTCECSNNVCTCICC